MSEPDDSSMPPRSRTALVTGGTTRLGLAIARQLAAEGWRVVTSSHRADAGADFVADFSLPHAPEELFDAVRSCLGGFGPDAIVNNAAVYAAVASDEDTWRINYLAPVRLSLLMNARGKVVNILDAHASRHKGSAYALSKTALALWTRENPALATGVEIGDVAELAPVGRHESAIDPPASRLTSRDVASLVASALPALGRGVEGLKG